MQCSTACYWIADRVDLYHDINVGHYGLSHILVTLWSVKTMRVMTLLLLPLVAETPGVCHFLWAICPVILGYCEQKSDEKWPS